MKKIHLSLLLIFATITTNFQNVCAQEQNAIDSLLKILKTTTIDTVKVDILNSLCQKYQRSNPEKAEGYVMQALQLAKKITYKKGIAGSLNHIGSIHEEQGNYNKAIENYQKALIIFQELGAKKGIANNLNNIGIIYKEQGNYDKAIEYYQQAINWARQNGDRIGETKALNQLGETFLELKKTSEAIETLKTSAEVFESLRPGLRDDEKVSLFETQSAIYSTWQTALVEQGNSITALEIAERGRARAFVELLAQRLSDKPQREAAVKYPILADIQAIAKSQQATLVTYSILSDSEIYVWIVNPNGNIGFKSIDLKPIEAKQQAIVASNLSQSNRGEQ
ncbi:MAG: tetratricopeptide repeat protein, partial [Chloroflexia bacterium]|nr:tetratricopeptide repeat protein [Chloroflexia bacterium]